jgi:HlyD family secretion protein
MIRGVDTVMLHATFPRKRESSALLLFVLATGLSNASEPRTVWISGEVRASQAEAIYVPPSNSSPVVLRYFVPEGAEVKPGDVLVRIDPGQSAAQLVQTESQLEQVRATAAKDIAALQVAAADAERALIDADAAQAKAKIDAAIPRQHLSALDHDRYQGELERATREQALKQREHATAIAAVERKRRDAALEADKLVADLAFHRAQVANAEQRAETAGTVVHGFDPWRGTRYDEGASANMGQRIGEVVGSGAMEVRGYALEPDRAGLAEGHPVTLHFDAFPGRSAAGKIVRISGAPDSRAQWGDGRYFTLDIEFGQSADLPLLAGMSVRAEAVVAPAADVAATEAR